MKKLSDKEIQQMLDARNKEQISEASKYDEDIRLFQILYNELEKEPEYSLADDFSSILITKIESKAAKKKHLQDIWLIVFSLCMIVTSLVVLAIFNFFSIFIEMAALINDYKWIVLFGVVALTFVQLSDRLLLKNKCFKYGMPKAPGPTA